MYSAKIMRLVALTFLLLFLTSYKSVSATGSCTASISPTSVQTSVGTDFTFSITNTGANAVSFVKLEAPSADFTMENHGVSGWSVSGNSSFAELSGGTIAAGASTNITYYAVSGSSEAASQDWFVSTNDGSGWVYCTGSLGVAIAGVTDITPPVISGIGVSSLTSSSAVITWTTDEASDSVVIYSSEGGNSGETTGNTSTTSHSVTLSGLQANTTYYYYVTSTDGSGNKKQSIENNFTTSTATAAPAATATATAAPTATTTTTTTTTTATATPAPVDRTAPRVSITTDLASSYEDAPTIEGTASDAKGVSSVQYSVDGGANWLPADEVTETGATAVEFRFTPELTEDGNYDVLVRALDPSGNTGVSDTILIIIDRLPPRVGGNLVSLGPLALTPDESGVIVATPGIAQRVTLSAVGGPVSVDMLIDERISSMGYSSQTGLWTGALNISDPGVYELRVRAVDGANNKTERTLGTVVVVDFGKVFDISSSKTVDKGEVTVYVQDPLTKLWGIWGGKTFGQDNPQTISETGEFEYYLPGGTYYVDVSVPGRPKLTSKIFTLDESTPFNPDFKLQARKTFNIGPIAIPLPSVFSDKQAIVLKSIKADSTYVPKVVGEELPFFILPSTEGEFNSKSLLREKSLISFINTWSPAATEQIPILDKYISETVLSSTVIVEQESLAKATIFQKRGNYRIPLVVDPDGELISDFEISSLPMHFFVDGNGIVKKVVSGVLTGDEIGQIFQGI